MSISFGVSTLLGLANGWETGCAITSGGVGSTAVIAAGYVWIGGAKCVVTGRDLNISAISPAFGWKYIFARLAAGQSSTATIDATSADPRPNGWAVIGYVKTTAAAGKLTGLTTSGTTGRIPFGRAMNCNINLSYDQAVARGGTLIFGNDMKLYNGACEGTLEYASITGANISRILGADWASAGSVSGTLTLTSTHTPLPFAIQAQAITNGVTSTVTLHKGYSNQITLIMDRENYTIPSISFQALADSEGDVLSWNI